MVRLVRQKGGTHIIHTGESVFLNLKSVTFLEIGFLMKGSVEIRLLWTWSALNEENAGCLMETNRLFLQERSDRQ